MKGRLPYYLSVAAAFGILCIASALAAQEAVSPWLGEWKKPAMPKPRLYAGLSGAASEFIGAGIVVLTMTDCNTVNGIIAIARMKEGGLLNVYEDRMLRQLLYHKR